MAQHRYWYFVNMPEVGARWLQGWCFGTDALAAARNAIEDIARTAKAIGRYNPAPNLVANDIHVTHNCACLEVG